MTLVDTSRSCCISSRREKRKSVFVTVFLVEGEVGGDRSVDWRCILRCEICGEIGEIKVKYGEIDFGVFYSVLWFGIDWFGGEFGEFEDDVKVVRLAHIRLTTNGKFRAKTHRVLKLTSTWNSYDFQSPNQLNPILNLHLVTCRLNKIYRWFYSIHSAFENKKFKWIFMQI
jgi:hypothetical protein